MKRELLTEYDYKGRWIEVVYIGPDLMAKVNNRELPSFYLNIEAAKRGAQRYVDDSIKEAQANKSKS